MKPYLVALTNINSRRKVMPDQEYALPGQLPNFPQVEPNASYWFRCPVLRLVSFKDIRSALDDELKKPENRYPLLDSQQAKDELNELRKLFTDREKPLALPQSQLSAFLREQKYVTRPPVGAVLSRRASPTPLLRTGGELARLFEAETPGLWHRHVLNVLFDPQVPNGLGQRLSPPRQALIWAALDVAISSALMAAWHYKWLATMLKQIARRERPVEADPTLGVLYDFRVAFDSAGNIIKGAKKPAPNPSPGTPRHPAYPSGHSTYSAAASHVLGCLIPSLKTEFDKLADNVGIARLWGGVHWRSDHRIGQLVGSTVGQLVIDQLNDSGISVKPMPEATPPSREELEQRAKDFAKNCGDKPSNFCAGIDLLTEDIGLQGKQG